MSCAAKTYTSLLNQRIVKYCDGNNIIVDEQNGFRKGRSCSDHLFTIRGVCCDDNCKNDNCKKKLTTTVNKFFTVVVVLIIENIRTVVVKVTLFGQRQM